MILPFPSGPRWLANKLFTSIGLKPVIMFGWMKLVEDWIWTVYVLFFFFILYLGTMDKLIHWIMK